MESGKSSNSDEGLEAASSTAERVNNTDTEMYEKIKCKVEKLDISFHPSENNLLYVGLINGKLKM